MSSGLGCTLSPANNGRSPVCFPFRPFGPGVFRFAATDGWGMRGCYNPGVPLTVGGPSFRYSIIPLFQPRSECAGGGTIVRNEPNFRNKANLPGVGRSGGIRRKTGTQKPGKPFTLSQAGRLGDTDVVEPELHAHEIMVLRHNLEPIHGGPVKQTLRIEPGIVPRPAIHEALEREWIWNRQLRGSAAIRHRVLAAPLSSRGILDLDAREGFDYIHWHR